jgi:hypothetical protein
MQNAIQKDKRGYRKFICRFVLPGSVFFRLILILMFFLLFIFPVAFAQSSLYVPSPPIGPTYGFVGIDYEYTIVTMNPDSLWMFDWGDGTNSPWLRLEENSSSIVQTHQWSQPGIYQLHVRYKGETAPYGIWSEAVLVEIRYVSDEDFPDIPTIQTAKILGIVGETYTYSAMSSDPNDQSVRYRFDFNDENLSTWTPYVPSGMGSYLSFSWQQPAKYYVRAQAMNKYGLHSEWSNPMLVIIKDDSEENKTSIDFLLINGIQYHIIFTSPYHGTLHNPSTGHSNDVFWNGGGVFLLDDNSDGRWDYFYIPSIGQIQPYAKPFFTSDTLFSKLPWVLILIIGGIILGVVGIVLVLIKTGYIYIYEEEVTIEE